MTVIDFRVRPPYKDFLDTVMYAQAARRDRITRAIGFEPSPAASSRSVQRLLAEMDQGGIDVGVVVGRNSGALGSVSNDLVEEFCGLHPGRFIPVGSIDPRNRRAAIAEIDRVSGMGFRAINIEPGGSNPPMHADDPKLYPIYAHCEDRGIPVILMTGGNAGPDVSFSDPVHIDRVLADFPELNVVASHGSWPWVHQILHVAFRRPNLFLSPDYLMANLPGMDDYVKAADGWLADRILYASAFPFAPVADFIAWFRNLPIRPDNLQRILYENAASLLRLNEGGSGQRVAAE
ncbi:MAG: amidohydrolase family protein [Rhizobiaceae bacterium]